MGTANHRLGQKSESSSRDQAKSVFFGSGKISGKKKTKTGPDIIHSSLSPKKSVPSPVVSSNLIMLFQTIC